ncbi:MAG TPA: DUF2442 domain-containing protein [Caldilineaceae bacterium]|nr:DUF2442 domain-containing protein [Caldilineaceae bacterium]
MSSLANKTTENAATEAAAVNVVVDDQWLSMVLSDAMVLSDGRVLQTPCRPIPWLGWLAQATPEQRAHWTLEPGGFAVYWPDLDDGVDVAHLLTVKPLTSNRPSEPSDATRLA